MLMMAVLSGAGAQAGDSAAELMQAKKYAEAAELLRAQVADSAADARAWYQLAICYSQLERRAEAVAAYSEAEKLGYRLTQIRYNLACFAALDGDTEAAFAWLAQSIDAGFNDPAHLREDTDLQSLHSDPRFDSLALGADKNARPCEYDERCRQFDFMLGVWDVFSAQGQTIAQSRWSRDLNGCLIRENWTDLYGSQGESINYFDPAAELWRQNWVADDGWITEYQGNFSDGALRYSGRSAYRDGSIKLGRSTFTPKPDGTVHHHIERSSDNGATWIVTFDAIYRPQSPADSL
ncbi:MAG TPA: hypothetical protein VLB27_11285 [candidate division Zixibacteria bacterium]|nr:hypothetical protein [candidate division Zixibacteria bacterium]